MRKILQAIKRETINIIPAVIFFLIAFNLITFTERLMLKNDPNSFISYSLATVGALLVGKFLLIVNSLPFINAFPRKPLIYNICWKFLIYGSFAMLFRIIDKAIHFTYEYERTPIVYNHIKMMVSSPRFWAIQLWLLILFLIYTAACEFIRVLGKEQVKAILFGSSE